MADALSERDLEAIVGQQIELAKSHDRSERATSREKAIDYYLGNMDRYVPPETNRSKVVSTDLADMVSTMLPQVIREFSSSGRIAVAEPTGPEDEEFAEQATQGLNYVFLKDNDGEGILYDGTWDSLVHGNAIIKTWYDPTPVHKTAFYSGLTEDQAALLLQDENTEVLAQSASEGQIQDPETGQMIPVKLLDLKLKVQTAPGKFMVDCIPPEEFLQDAATIKTEEAAFTDHWQRKTRSDLVGMGYDRDQVAAIPSASPFETAEQNSRRPGLGTYEPADKSMQLVDYHECFIRIDVDGDGEAEMVRACFGGDANGKLLHWEVYEDENPFDDVKCKPIPHRWLARSLADDTIDIQDVKTVLRRSFLNSIYWGNNPQRFAKGKIHNPDQLDNPTFGGTVFGDANAVVETLETPQTAEASLLGIQHMDDVAQRRTGIVAQGEAIDPNELNTKTAAEVHDKKDARYVQVSQIARNNGRGWGKVFGKLLRLMAKHQDYARTVMFNGKPVTIDPRFWNADMNVTIDVGLGTGSRDRDMQMLGQVLQSQLLLADRFMAAGATADAIDMLPKIIDTMTKMAESAGIQNAEDYFPEYTEEKVAQLKQLAAQPKPDPALALEQAKQQGAMQVEQARGETQKQLKVVDAQVDQHAAELKAQGEVVKNQAELEADLQTKEADRQNAIAIETVKQQGAYNIELMRIASAERIKQMDLQHQAEQAAAARDNAVQLAAMKPKPEPRAN